MNVELGLGWGLTLFVSGVGERGWSCLFMRGVGGGGGGGVMVFVSEVGERR